MSTKSLGNIGEEIAVEFLQRHGYKICNRNYRVPIGEIDIIAQKKDLIIFVEVKTRRSLRYGEAVLAVNYHKQQKIIKVAYWYKQEHNVDGFSFRFDVIEVYLMQDGNKYINHFENAFEIR